MRKIFIALSAAALFLTGCTTKNVDVDQTGAIQVPGITNLYHFCDRTTGTLIYFSQWPSSNDEYEWFYPGGCDTQGNTVIYTPSGSIPNGDSTEDK